MANLASLLTALARPILVKIMSSLGLGVISYVGTTAAINQLVALVRDNLSGMPQAAAGIFGMAGGYTAISILLGALTFRVSMMVFDRVGVMTK